jgi:hypothetical protein
MIMMNKNFIETLDSFKKFILSKDVYNYVIRYCKQLNEVKRIWLHAQMIEAVMITDEPGYLFYVPKWYTLYLELHFFITL